MTKTVCMNKYCGNYRKIALGRNREGYCGICKRPVRDIEKYPLKEALFIIRMIGVKL